MKPIVQLASTMTPNGKKLILREHDGDMTILVGNEVLMLSRQHESELELARLGCRRIKDRMDPTVLIGGLGMGYTLRQTLDLLQPRAKVIVAELMPEIVEWNRKYLGALTDHPLRDKRVKVEICDVNKVIQRSEAMFDTIMLDLDNGPVEMTWDKNRRVYSREGIQSIMRALHKQGCLMVWSASVDKAFEKRLHAEGMHTRRFFAPAYKNGKSTPFCILAASQDLRSLPALPPRPERPDRKDEPPPSRRTTRKGK